MKKENDFSKNPLEMLDVSLKYFISNEKMPDKLKDTIREQIPLLYKIPEGIIMEAIDPFLEANIFEHDLKDLSDCGLYAFIYSTALSLVAGSRKGGFE